MKEIKLIVSVIIVTATGIGLYIWFGMQQVTEIAKNPVPEALEIESVVPPLLPTAEPLNPEEVAILQDLMQGVTPKTEEDAQELLDMI